MNTVSDLLNPILNHFELQNLGVEQSIFKVMPSALTQQRLQWISNYYGNYRSDFKKNTHGSPFKNAPGKH